MRLFEPGDRVIIVDDGDCREEFWGEHGTVVKRLGDPDPDDLEPPDYEVLLDSERPEHRSVAHSGAWYFEGAAVTPEPPLPPLVTIPEIDAYLEEGSDASA